MLTISISLVFLKVEPPRKRFHSGNEQKVLQNTWQTQRVDRVAQCGVSRVTTVYRFYTYIY